jgi:hypothetical protein
VAGIRLIERDIYRGDGSHVTGWPFVVMHLRQISEPGGLLLDDFVEHTVDCQTLPHREPWVGIFHHPPCRHPQFVGQPSLPHNFSQTPAFVESTANLRLIVTLSDHLGSYWREVLPDVPQLTLKHPAAFTDRLFDGRRLGEKDMSLWQVGAYLRNTRAIHQVPPMRRVFRLKGWVPPFASGMDDRLRRADAREEFPGVVHMPKIEPQDYDEMMAGRIVLSEYLDAAASNVLIECVVRHTPFLTNRLPAHQEYLGDGYPLFFDDISEVPELLEPERLLAGHKHLARMSKNDLTIGCFLDTLLREVRGL